MPGEGAIDRYNAIDAVLGAGARLGVRRSVVGGGIDLVVAKVACVHGATERTVGFGSVCSGRQVMHLLDGTNTPAGAVAHERSTIN
ncbi:hypothetical protein [Streptomyces cylindrosporus]|uniref:Uncharacterized protein n=1 Tax=Streptomyces cylindrosporus TaxID=2927583 RepID=A0ABS9Y0Q4_9ACTN|nr:hypothetical protein [Streptomyces cylindrosporus]MCI3270765.1 hypothetical protein [Streptomyces cylindrosporus]